MNDRRDLAPSVKTDPMPPAATRAAPAPAPRPLRRFAPFAPFVAGGAVTLVAVLAISALLPHTPAVTENQVDTAIASALASVTPPPAYSALVYQAVQPSLVLVQVDRPSADASTAPKPEPAASAAPDAGRQPHDGLGSGVVISAAGDILTSLHVVDGASVIDLTFADGSTSPAEVVSTQPDHDIAVLRATDPPADLVPATIGNPAAVRPGSEAYALGSPFGLYGSVSAGIISGLDRSFTIQETGQKLTGLIQIDAAVNPGNSGGALVDRNGLVIGIVTALVNPTKEDVFIGIGLAVPIDVAGRGAGLPPY